MARDLPLRRIRWLAFAAMLMAFVSAPPPSTAHETNWFGIETHTDDPPHVKRNQGH